MDMLDDMGVSKLSAKTFFESELILEHILFGYLLFITSCAFIVVICYFLGTD